MLAGEGRFQIPDLRPFADCGLLVQALGFATIGETVKAGETEIELPHTVRLSSRVLTAEEGAPIAKAHVAWKDETHAEYVKLHSGMQVPTTSEGLLHMELPIGVIDLRVGAPDREIRTLSGVTIPERAGLEIPIELKRASQPAGPGGETGGGGGGGGGTGGGSGFGVRIRPSGARRRGELLASPCGPS